MKDIYGVYLTDEWESRASDEYIGFFSTPKLARASAAETLRHNDGNKVVIEKIIVDEVDGGAKFEVYCFKNGLEWKSKESDAAIGHNPVADTY